jgi:hypothetical protein
MEKAWKEAVLALFEVQSQLSTKRTEESHEKPVRITGLRDEF